MIRGFGRSGILLSVRVRSSWVLTESFTSEVVFFFIFCLNKWNFLCRKCCEQTLVLFYRLCLILKISDFFVPRHVGSAGLFLSFVTYSTSENQQVPFKMEVIGD